MTLSRFLLLVCASFLATALLQAQSAQDIIDSSAKVYAAATSFSADVDSRTINFVFPPSHTGRAPRYEAARTQYRRLKLRVARPHDYFLGAQTFTENNRTGAAFVGETGGSTPWTFLSRAGNTPPRQGVNINGRYETREVPSGQFDALVNSRFGARATSDFVLRYFRPHAVSDGASMTSLGLIEPEIIGRETRDRPTFRIFAKTASGALVMLWIEQDTFLIVRSVVQRPRQPVMSGSGARTPMQMTPPSQVNVVETIYNNQRIDVQLSAADLAIPASTSADRASSQEMGFSSVADLMSVADIKPFEGKPGSPDDDDADEMDDTAKPGEPVTKTDAPVEGQALSYEQMSGIILIDGDGGTASGFMTKIRDVDFVVTNLHVLVGNKKMTLKNLRGEEIPMQGIFGAMGSDIAIIRVAKSQGDLRLTSDVFKTSKIGDKVVVVGNRRGGGVATQTNGSIRGIGPSLIEVDANFQSGNSGSPIVNLSTNEVIGVATYSETRRVEVDGPASKMGVTNTGSEIEKRWFGYRLDSVAKWEAIDLNKWNAQADRITKFRETSEALHDVIRFEFRKARQHPRLTMILDSFDAKYRNAGNNSLTAATEVKDLFRVIRTISDDGMRDLSVGDYYDYYRTCQYWENSIPAQLEYRKAIVDVLRKYEANSSLYLSRMRGN